MLSIAVLVSGNGTNLQAMIDAEKNKIIKSGKINLVISSKADVFALERAKKADIKSLIIKKSDYSKQNLYENALIDALNENKIDLIVLAGYMTILSPKLINIYKDRIINIHPSLIPSFCGENHYGLRVHKAVLEYGVKITGATVHFVNEIVDGGKIISQKAVDVLDDDTPEILQKRVMEQAEWIILPEAVETVCQKLLNEK